eukprot:CAMPEP_0194694034 /NCGR_PEP_ID=MMETSP0295-20121207/20976_1 /TAXON_ID=39354 /ORGANISM="Heterosigma akashiwo, Strain CCMP2393" /LENGTH=56 /DNA_ID=CAMNT_0039585209 /DNA_START=167 /DNA_END=337 /DNA_ORIENTATION=-
MPSKPGTTILSPIISFDPFALSTMPPSGSLNFVEEETKGPPDVKKPWGSPDQGSKE